MSTNVKSNRVAIWLCFIASALWALAGLRDTFAPGFFNVSPQVKTGSDIALEFSMAVLFFFVGVSFSGKLSQSKHD